MVNALSFLFLYKGPIIVHYMTLNILYGFHFYIYIPYLYIRQKCVCCLRLLLALALRLFFFLVRFSNILSSMAYTSIHDTQYIFLQSKTFTLMLFVIFYYVRKILCHTHVRNWKNEKINERKEKQKKKSCIYERLYI